MKMLTIRLAVWWLERRGAVDRFPCRAYGGVMADGSVRLCDKWRWHTDSHTYEISRSAGRYRDGGVIR